MGESLEANSLDALKPYSASYVGQANDPLTAFYDLSERIAGDVLSVVSPRSREDMRVIFRG